jgi:hypothetical protein
VNNVTLPLSLRAQPNWLIPTNTNALAVAAQGTVPITMDVSWLFGDPDVLGASSGNKLRRRAGGTGGRSGVLLRPAGGRPGRSPPLPPGR